MIPNTHGQANSYCSVPIVLHNNSLGTLIAGGGLYIYSSVHVLRIQILAIDDHLSFNSLIPRPFLILQHFKNQEWPRDKATYKLSTILHQIMILYFIYAECSCTMYSLSAYACNPSYNVTHSSENAEPMA